MKAPPNRSDKLKPVTLKGPDRWNEPRPIRHRTEATSNMTKSATRADRYKAATDALDALAPLETAQVIAHRFAELGTTARGREAQKRAIGEMMFEHPGGAPAFSDFVQEILDGQAIENLDRDGTAAV